jgi:hypothetical protein
MDSRIDLEPRRRASRFGVVLALTAITVVGLLMVIRGVAGPRQYRDQMIIVHEAQVHFDLGDPPNGSIAPVRGTVTAPDGLR